MKKIIAVVLVLSLLCLPTLSGCGSSSGSAGEVNVYNWGEYIDESLFDLFEEQTGIKVNYQTYPNNESMYSTLKTGGASYDVIFPSDYMVSRLIQEDMLEKINFDNVPNFELVDDVFKSPDYDPTSEYSVPYTWGTVGLIYNSDMIDEEITSWSALFNPDYSGQILMFDNSRDAFGIALKYLGYSQNTTDENELNEAYELLESQKPILQAYVMDQIFSKLESGEAAIGPYYAGDYLTMKETNPALKFVIPDEGSNLFYDAMCIPKGAENKENAEKFINFMCSTEACIANMDVTGYASVNREAWEEYSADLSEEDKNVMYPSDEVIERCDVFINLPQEILDKYDEMWISLKSS